MNMIHAELTPIGSGKTTLLGNLLKNPKGERIAVVLYFHICSQVKIENEFVLEVGLENELKNLASSRNEGKDDLFAEIVELGNGTVYYSN
jgi:G3E family GTPase